jgi:hypothetical protein
VLQLNASFRTCINHVKESVLLLLLLLLLNESLLNSTSTYGPGSSVGIATDYSLDGPEIESRWERDFSHTSRPALGPT